MTSFSVHATSGVEMWVKDVLLDQPMLLRLMEDVHVFVSPWSVNVLTDTKRPVYENTKTSLLARHLLHLLSPSRHELWWRLTQRAVGWSPPSFCSSQLRFSGFQCQFKHFLQKLSFFIPTFCHVRTTNMKMFYCDWSTWNGWKMIHGLYLF